jgi:uncharacterized protein (DUF433 family)
MVWQVLEQVAQGMPSDEIMAEWRGSVTGNAISEAVELFGDQGIAASRPSK